MLTEEQLRMRQTGIGGTDAAAIMGLNKYKSALDVYHEKIADEIIIKEPNQYMQWGTAVEEPIRWLY